VRLNKYQKAWIARLKSGKTRKAKYTLADGKGGNCCLGVAINACKLEKMPPLESKLRGDEDLTRLPKTLKALNLNDPTGRIDLSKINPIWDEKIMCDSLIGLNDYTEMPHKEIGEFIDQNREAVFKS